MPLPGFQDVMLPLLRLVAAGAHVRIPQLAEAISDHFQLTPQERSALIPSGRKRIIYDRVSWAAYYLRKALILSSPRRGVLEITPRGRDILESTPDRVDVRTLNRFPEFLEWHTSGRIKSTERSATAVTDEATPEEALIEAYQNLRQTVQTELLEAVKRASPAFFEALVIELLVKMGYGGSIEDAGQAIGGSGDGGIDGIIKEDRLGLDAIYIQAKRWDSSSIGRPEVQAFAGALQGRRARKGVFITTSSFAQTAREFVERIDAKIVLIDGEMLTRLMFEHNVGVSLAASYHVKKIDSDFFEEE